MTTPSFVFPLVDVPPSPTGRDSSQERSAIQTLKRSFLLDTAEAEGLAVIGGNYGVPAPLFSADAELFRRLIPVLAWQPKTISFTTNMLLTAVFGSQADITTLGGRPWRIFEINANEFVLEIPLTLITATNENASYMHGETGYARVAAGPSNTFTCTGDVRKSSATTLVGKDIQVFFANVWNSYTISSVTYNTGTDLSTVVVSASTLPAGGGVFIITVPGDGVSSFSGDYIGSSEFVSSFFAENLGAPPTANIFVLGDATIHLAVGHTVTLAYGGVDHAYTIAAMTAYSPSTNRTQLTMDAVTVESNVMGSIIKTIDLADTPTTPMHDLRVYLTGLGLLDVVTYYMNLLVRAAGIVMRIELI